MKSIYVQIFNSKLKAIRIIKFDLNWSSDRYHVQLLSATLIPMFEVRNIWKIYLNQDWDRIRTSCVEWTETCGEIQEWIPPSWHVEIQLLSISNHHRSWWTPMVTGLREPRKPISIFFFFFFFLSTSTYRSKQRNTFCDPSSNIYFNPSRNFLLYLFFLFLKDDLIRWWIIIFYSCIFFSYFLKEIRDNWN